MTNYQIDCLEFIEYVKHNTDLSEKANLSVILVGDNDASNLYVNSKVKESTKWNVDVSVHKFPSASDNYTIISAINKLNDDPNVDGIIVQLPLPKHLNTQAIINAIAPIKNVDGFAQNFGNKVRNSLYEPCTPKGIMMLLNHLCKPLNGKMVTLIGRGKTIGEPLRDILLRHNVTLAICHSKTKYKDLENLLRVSDIVICATGIAKLVNGKCLKKDAIVIDAGISRINGRQVGDYDNTTNVSAYYTPWVNGVGKLTVMALMLNTRNAHSLRKLGVKNV